MARLFPLRSETPTREGQPRVVDLEDEDADAVFSALSSTTARRIYSRLNEEPGTPSDVADAIDSSIQNVRYHLEKLEEAGLVEVVDTWYSSRGNEMSVYSTADGPLIVTSDRSTADQLKTALSRFIGGVAALAGGSLLVQYGLSQYFSPAATESTRSGNGDGAAAGNGAAATDGNGDAPPETEDEAETGDDADADSADSDEPTTEEDEGDIGAAQTDDADSEDEEPGDDAETDDEDAAHDEADEPDSTEDSESVESDDTAESFDSTDGGNETAYTDGGVDDGNATVDGAVEGAEAIFATVPPGLLFFLGGLVVLIAVTVYWYWSATY
ncbi:helix-turn-helix domain-containing protein [Natronosalvus vescus]|uniref:helix-turn-helix domain-containing protein n=1 Tax=Natronosalvus vescus TaxID=2953881 RepID=UPI002091546D|nr:helix-turn-helix domain-containing protein [Natronosalvus vescus]